MSISVSTFSLKGEITEKTTLPAAVFGIKNNTQATTQAIRVYLANQRKAGAKTKTRSEVSKTTAKMYKQKGTGKARHGTYAAPIFVGGGIAHGPTGEQNYTLKMSKGMRVLAIKSAFSNKADNKKIAIIHTEKMEGKTKEGEKLLMTAGVAGSALMVVGKGQELVKRSFRNLKNVSLVTPGGINVYILLKSKWLLITKEALAEIAVMWEEKK
jgi:large subunit ribosomal protein L4